jgi:hypothetical protein
MKALVPIAASLALALAPAAHAQISCVELTLVLQSGLSDFEQIKGAPDKDEENVWRSSFSLPGAGQCYVLKGKADAWVYTCDSVFKGESTAASAFDASVASVASCLSSWTRQPVVNSPAPGRVLDSAAFIGANLNRGFTVALELVEFDDERAGRFWALSTIVERRPG